MLIATLGSQCMIWETSPAAARTGRKNDDLAEGHDWAAF